jgi:amino acid adenylation domain-containing protein
LSRNRLGDQGRTTIITPHPTSLYTPFPREALVRSIPDRFEQIVEDHPLRLAIKNDGRSVTYAELNRTANKIAHAILQQFGFTSQPVAILLTSGIPAVASFLGSMKAGKFHTLLDTDFPENRLRVMLTDLQPALLLTDSRHLHLAQELAEASCNIVNLDELLEADLPVTNPHLKLAPQRLAEIVYTTGSTGRPKGVLKTHLSILHNCLRSTNVLHLSADDRITIFASLNTGQGAATLYRSLLVGATACMWRIRRDGVNRLADWLRSEAITVFYASVTVFRTFAHTLTGSGEFPALRLVRLGGETASVQDVELYQKFMPAHCLLLNSLASTETSLITANMMNHQSEVSVHVPVGHAVEGIDISIYNADGAEVGPNQSGEIVIKSRFISPGYWRQPELTAARFRPSPHGTGESLFFSGDLGFIEDNGRLTHLGRVDDQIKLRGYRVVLGEVEAAIRALPSCRDAIVSFDQEHDRLLAHVIPAHMPPESHSTLRAALATQLPDYALPARFVYLDSFPMQPSGKVDRDALPKPNALRPNLGTPLVGPRTPLEETLSDLWVSLLEIQSVSVHDSFFELGGQSLLTARLILEVEQKHGITVSMDSFLQDPTVAHLAGLVEHGQPRGVVNKLRPDAPLLSALTVLEMPRNFIRDQKPTLFAELNKPSQLAYLCLHRLPQDLLFILLPWVTRSAPMRSLLLKRKVDLISRFLPSIECPVPLESALESSLYFYLIDRYGIGLSNPSQPTVSIPIDGLEKVQMAKEAGKGAIVVRSHDNGRNWFASLQLADHRVSNLRYLLPKLHSRRRFDEQVLYAHQLHEAIKTLKEGLVVEVHGDGRSGASRGLEFPFHGRRRRFMTGFAELALITGAPVFVVQFSLDRPAQPRVKLVGPLNSGDPTMTCDERVKMLVSQYVRALAEQWSHEPWMIPLFEMEFHLSYPLNGSEQD